jgi:hypothetical protein
VLLSANAELQTQDSEGGENLGFDGFHYRTARLNEASLLIYSVDKDFGGNKKKTNRLKFRFAFL